MVHPGGLEVAVAVVEVADVAWAALERHRDHSTAAETMCRDTELELEREQQENRRLRALLEQYQKALEHAKIQGGTGDLDNSEFELFERLKEKVDSPEFLGKLASVNEGPDSPERAVVTVADDPSSWLWVTDMDLSEKDSKVESDDLGSDGYLIVNQDDIVDGIATFMARYISSMPQTKGMTPQELQKAISKAFTDLEKKGKFQKLWQCGKVMYTAASWGATLVSVYKNPLIVRAASMALWTSCCVIVRLLT